MNAPDVDVLGFGVAGAVWGHVTEHGGGLTGAIAFGRIAGVNAAAVRS